jgi:hypothetical protein
MHPHDFGGPKVEAPPLPADADLFAVRHRLRRHSPASPFGPFVVELFAGGFYRPHAEPCHWPGPVCRQTEAPHAGLVKRTSRDFHPICAECGALVRIPKAGLARLACITRFEPLRPRRALLHELRRGLSLSPSPPELEWDRTLGFLRTFTLPNNGSQIRDYSNEPPSNRTSHSRGIRLYGPTSMRMVSPLS